MLVPTKSTPEMREAFKRAYQDGSIWTERIDYALEQFIEAAPQPPQAGASDDGAAPWPECKHRVCHKNGACWDAGKCLDPAARAAPIVAMRPVDASQNGGMVVLHFRSAQDANRFRSCASMNIGVAQNITAPAPAEPKQYTDLIHRLQYGKPFTRIEILDALLALGAFPGAPNSEQRAATCPRCKSTTAQGCNDMNCGYVESEQRAATLSDEQRLSLTSPLTPYGLLVRALRIVAGTTLYDMSKALLTTPAKLSAMEFGRTPVTQEFAFDVSAYFDALGIPDTLAALKAALLSTLNGDKHE
jgi:hypothetical protein